MFQQVMEYVRTHAWVNGLVNLSILALAGAAIYRYLMSPRGEKIRRRFPTLDRFYGRRIIRKLIEAGEYAQAGDGLAALGQFDQAIAVYQPGNLFGRAADVYMRRKKPERAAALYERAGEFFKAADTYLDLKLYEQDEEILRRADRR